ncbi:glycoside hydrolase family 2 protein [Domibacillus tundrae]|uniref:glycoside hydrolase family 2 protein n=1 Tax=Domibacillus tundrae TaxID=1587527 RepID=UPI003394EFD7
MTYNYPRPQLVRDEWVNLNGEWSFAFDDDNRGLSQKWQKQFPEALKINVPFAYQTKLSGIHDPSFHDIVWYSRTITIPQEWQGKQIILHFGAVDYRAWIYVNGELVTFHEGGNTPFKAIISEAVQEGNNQIVVRVEDPSEDQTIPRGKQYWHEQSESIFYTRTTGIWQTVWMEAVEPIHVQKLRWTPNVDKGDIQMELELSGIDHHLEVTVDISYNGKNLINDTLRVHEIYTKRSFNIRNRFVDRSNIHNDGWYWTPENPNLFDVVLTVKTNQTVDRVSSYFGMRKVSVHNGEFRLNNKRYYQKLILDQGYFPEGLLTAPDSEALKRDIELAKEMGFNGARKHQKVEDPRYLYWADRLGFLVWGEMANAGEYSEEAAERLTKEWMDVVNRDYNHPCIVAWMPLNESWGISRVAHEIQQQHHSLAMYYVTKSLDQTRPVLSNDGWEHTISDFCGIHNYQSAEEIERAYATIDSAIQSKPANRQIYADGFSYRGEPILITEYGGIAYTVDESGWGYSSVQSSEELVEQYEAVTAAIGQSPILQGYCYTQLTDVEQEINGLLTYDRKPKCDLKKIKEINDRFS